MDKSSALVFLTRLTVLLSFGANVRGSPVYSFVNSDDGAGDNSTLVGKQELHGVGNTSAVHLQLIQVSFDCIHIDIFFLSSFGIFLAVQFN